MSHATRLGIVALLTGLTLPAVGHAQTLVADPYVRIVRPVMPAAWDYAFNPYAGYLRGTAAVIRSQGQYLIDQQVADLKKEEVRQKKLETHKLRLEHLKWEYEFTAKAYTEKRELDRQLQVQRARFDPPLTEIRSGKAPNDLRFALSKLTSRMAEGRSAEVNQESLHFISTHCGMGGNLGLLKEDTLPWPPLLLERPFEASRGRVHELVAVLREEVNKYSSVKPERRAALEREVRSLQEQVAARVREEEANRYIQARTFLSQLHDAATMLAHKDAVVFLRPIEGKTVAEVVDYLTRNGLEIAPATRGNERHYKVFWDALAKELDRVHPENTVSPTGK